MTGTKPVLEALVFHYFFFRIQICLGYSTVSVGERYTNHTFWRNVVPWKYQEPLSKWHIILSQKTWIL